jgi:hypothetical protein
VVDEGGLVQCTPAISVGSVTDFNRAGWSPNAGNGTATSAPSLLMSSLERLNALRLLLDDDDR